MKMNRDTNNFISSDLGLAAALTASGFEMIGVNRADPKRALFVFHKNDALERATRDYFNGKLTVSALSYFNAQKNIKSMLYFQN